MYFKFEFIVSISLNQMQDKTQKRSPYSLKDHNFIVKKFYELSQKKHKKRKTFLKYDYF